MNQTFDKEEFKQEAERLTNWLSEYLSGVDKFPVRAQVKPGEVLSGLPLSPPEKGETLESIFSDFLNILLPGITHWQSPSFHAYFPANSSLPSVLAEYLTAGLGVQGMKWITSPAATELEIRVTEWLRQLLGLPDSYTGVIHDTASVATLCAILAAREQASEGKANYAGSGITGFRVYCSEEAHASVEKAVRISGIGSDNLVKIPVSKYGVLDFRILHQRIEDDISLGLKPTCMVAALGTTGTCAVDPIQEMGELASKYAIWFHIDAAFAGTALILPEIRKEIRGIEYADSFVFNPHKWLFTNFDCSVFFVKDRQRMEDTFRLVPEYLQTSGDNQVQDLSNLGIQLGRRFRALKLWYVLRYYGSDGIREILREHINYAAWFAKQVETADNFELIVPRSFSLVCFRYHPREIDDPEKLDLLNQELMEQINRNGKLFLSHTRVSGIFTLRMVTAQTYVQMKDVERAWDHIREEALTIEL